MILTPKQMAPGCHFFHGIVLKSNHHAKKSGLVRLSEVFNITLLFHVGFRDVNVAPLNSCALKWIELTSVPYRGEWSL